MRVTQSVASSRSGLGGWGRSLVLALAVVVGAGCSSPGGEPDSLAGEWTHASLTASVRLDDRSMGAPGGATELPAVDLSIATALLDFTIGRELRDGVMAYDDVALQASSQGYGGGVALRGGRLDQISADLRVPATAPASGDAEAWLRLDAPGTIALTEGGDTFEVVVVGPVYRELAGIIGVEVPDGLFEGGTASLTIRAARR